MCLLSKSNCRTLQFLHQIFNVSALLLDDELLNVSSQKLSCFQLLLKDTDITGGSITNVLLIPTAKKIKIRQYLTKLRRTNKVCHFFPPCIQ